MNTVTTNIRYYENLFQRLRGEDFYLVVKRHFWRYKLGWDTDDTLNKKLKEFIDDIYNRQQILKNKKPDLLRLCHNKWEESEIAISNAHRKNRSNDFDQCIDDLCNAYELIVELEKLEKIVTNFNDAKEKIISLRNLLDGFLYGSLPIITLINSFFNKAQKYIETGDVIKAQLFVQIITRDLDRLLYFEKDPLLREQREKRLERLEKTVSEIIKFTEPIQLINKYSPMKESVIKLLSNGYVALCDELFTEAESFLSNSVYCMQQIIMFQTVFPNDLELKKLKDAFRTGNQESWRIIGNECIQKINSVSISKLDCIDDELSLLLNKN